MRVSKEEKFCRNCADALENKDDLFGNIEKEKPPPFCNRTDSGGKQANAGRMKTGKKNIPSPRHTAGRRGYRKEGKVQLERCDTTPKDMVKPCEI